MTTFHCRRLNIGQRFATSKAAIRATFTEVPLDFVTFGKFGQYHRWDRRLLHAPEIHGAVLAAATVPPTMGGPYLSIYPVSMSLYPDKARDEFNTLVLTYLRDFVVARLNKPATAPEGYEELVVEWTGSEHRLHAVRYQTGLERPRPPTTAADAEGLRG